MLDQHRRRRHFALKAIIAAPVAISRNRNFFPVALDDIHLAMRIVAVPPEDDGLRRRLIAKPNLETHR